MAGDLRALHELVAAHPEAEFYTGVQEMGESIA